MNDAIFAVLISLTAAFGVLGALWRLLPEEAWPAWLAPLGAGAWYVVAAGGGALAAMWALGQSGNGGGDEPDYEAPEPTTAADEAEAETDKVREDDESPNAETLADQMDELGGDG